MKQHEIKHRQLCQKCFADLVLALTISLNDYKSYFNIFIPRVLFKNTVYRYTMFKPQQNWCHGIHKKKTCSDFLSTPDLRPCYR